jgi:cell division septal protein FtsQ
MKRRKNKSKASQPRFHFAWLRYAIVLVVIVFLAVVGYRQTVAFFKKSDLFMIRDIAVDPSLEFIMSSKLSSLKGKNLFAVNLAAVQRQLQYEYPQVSELKLTRRFPDKVLVTARRRTPAANMVIRNQDVVLDEEGVILPSSAGNGLELPALTGVNTRDWKPIIGSRLKARDLSLALKILKAFRQEPALVTYRIRRLDVSNFSHMVFYLSDNLQIILDREDISDKMKTLGLVLSQTRNELGQVKYIDLRFREPVLGKKE